MRFYISVPLLFAVIWVSAQVTFIPNSTLLVGNYGAPACVVDMNGDNLDDVVRLNVSEFTIDFQQSNGTFTHLVFDTTQLGSVWSVCAGDLNNDGYTDILYGGASRVEIVRAINNGTDYESTQIPDYIFSQRSTLNDIDNDGWLDAFVCHDTDQNHPLRNDGTGILTEDQSLVPTASAPEGGNYAAIWVDYDNDQDQDLYITKCSAGAPITDERRINQMYRNDNGSFTEVAGLIGLKDSAQSWCTVFEDFDNDGDFDAFTVNHTDQNKFLENDGAGNFTNIIASTGIDAGDLGAWEAQAGDFNNDGFIDIFSEVGGGLYLNNGNMTFTNQNISPDKGGIGDLNNDGWLDYQLAGTIYMNGGGTNHWVKFHLEGTQSAIDGIGSRIMIYGVWGVQTRELRSGQGFSHMNHLVAHFGLGTATAIDSVVVQWPSGIRTSLENPSIDNLHVIPEVSCVLPSFAISTGGVTSLCPGDSVMLSAPNGYTSYEWSNGLMTQSIYASQDGNYSVQAGSANNCVAFSDVVNVSVVNEPKPIIVAPYSLSFCQGDAITLQAASSLPYVWNTGGSNDSIVLTSSGDHWLVATGICGQYNSDTVTVTAELVAPDPLTNGAFLPGPGSAILTATGNNVRWYDQPNAIDSIGSGNSWQTPSVNQTTSFWAEAREIYPSAAQSGGRDGIYSGGGLTSTNGKLIFSASEPFILRSVDVFSVTPGLRTIELQDPSGATLASSSVNLTVGVITVNLNFLVDQGSFYRLACLEGDLFRHNTGTQYPYAIGDVGLISGSSHGPLQYYYFYDWVVEPVSLDCPSGRVPAVVDVSNSIQEETSAIEMRVFPNPSAGLVTISHGMQHGNATLRVFNATGSLLLSKEMKLNQEPFELDLEGFADGQYSISLMNHKEHKQVSLTLVGQP